ncbi:MAG: hypothetical protein ACP5UD_09735, partial [Conexivisphaera sp.]
YLYGGSFVTVEADFQLGGPGEGTGRRGDRGSIGVDLIVTAEGIPSQLEAERPVLILSLDDQAREGDNHLQHISLHPRLEAPTKRLLLQLIFVDKGSADLDLEAAKSQLALLMKDMAEDLRSALSPYFTLAWMGTHIRIDKRVGNWLFYYFGSERQVGPEDLHRALEEDLVRPAYPYFSKGLPLEDIESGQELARRFDELINNGLLKIGPGGISVDESYSEFLLKLSNVLVSTLYLHHGRDWHKTMDDLVDLMFGIGKTSAGFSKAASFLSGSGLLDSKKAQDLLYFAAMSGALVRAADEANHDAFRESFLRRAGSELESLRDWLQMFKRNIEDGHYARYYLTAKERDAKVIDAMSVGELVERLLHDIESMKSMEGGDATIYTSILRRTIIASSLKDLADQKYRESPHSAEDARELDGLLSELRDELPWKPEVLRRIAADSGLAVDEGKLRNIVEGKLEVGEKIRRYHDLLRRADLGCPGAPCIAKEVRSLINGDGVDEHSRSVKEIVGKSRGSQSSGEGLTKLSAFLERALGPGEQEGLRSYLEREICSGPSDRYGELCELLRLSNAYREFQTKAQRIHDLISNVSRVGVRNISMEKADSAIKGALRILNYSASGLEEIPGANLLGGCSEGTSPSSASPERGTATGGSTIGPSTNITS